MELGQFAMPTTAVHGLFGTTAILLIALALAIALRRNSAALRHRTWSLSVGAVLVLPVVAHWAPHWRLGWLKEPTVLVSRQPATSPPSKALLLPQATPSAVDGGIEAWKPTLDPIQAVEAAPRKQAATPSGPPVDAVEQSASPVISEGARASDDSMALSDGADIWLLVWLIGVVAAAWPLLRSLLAVRQIVAQASPLSDVHCREIATSVAAQLTISRLPVLLQSHAISSPLCVGWWHPMVLLPSDWRKWPDEHLRAALAHEFAHVGRRDVGWQLLARLACIVYWMHPLVWLAAWRMRVERETACDDRVLEIGEQPSRYARLLLSVATDVAQRRTPDSGVAVAMASAARTERRIRAILRSDLCRRPVSRRVGELLTIVTAGVVVLAAVISPYGTRGGLALAETGTAVSEVDLQPSSREEPAERSEASPDTTPESNQKREQAGRQPGETPVEIRGRILDEQERGVAGALVEVIALPEHPATRSGADGVFSLKVALESSVLARAQARVLVRARADEGRLQGTERVLLAANVVSGVTVELKPAREIVAAVSNSDGAAVNGAIVSVVADTGTLDEVATDASGRAVLHVPREVLLRHIIAAKPHVGLDYVVFWLDRGDRSRQLPQDHDQPVTMVLDGAHAIDLRVLDKVTDKPLPGTRVRLPGLQKRGQEPLLVSRDVAGLNGRTDEQGSISFSVIPTDVEHLLIALISRPGYMSEQLRIDPNNPESNATVRLDPVINFAGRVQDANGAPAEGATVRIIGRTYQGDSVDQRVQTGLNGEFETRATSGGYYSVVAEHGRMASKTHTVWMQAGERVQDLELVLRPMTRVFGRVTLAPNSHPVPNRDVWLDYDVAMPYPEIKRSVRTDDQGRYEFFAGPGSYELRVPLLQQEKELVSHGDAAIEINFVAVDAK